MRVKDSTLPSNGFRIFVECWPIPTGITKGSPGLIVISALHDSRGSMGELPLASS